MKREYHNEPGINMRVLQLIDSLRPGGAERMSVNYANALAKRIDGSFLCCTRMEGLLKSQLAPQVGYLFLEKRSRFGLKALFKLRSFARKNKINIIQAHGSSWFMAVLLKISLPKVKLVWHDHFGERAEKKLKPGILSIFSRYFDGIICVNSQLKDWAEKNLNCKKVSYIPNFPSRLVEGGALPGLNVTEGFKIVHLANLKQPKDHLTLLKAFQILVEIDSSVSLHLIGKEEEDLYSKELKKFLKENGLNEKVHFYGEQGKVADFLAQADVGVLSSSSEGLPVALLEYGLAGLPVVCTAVGECEAVVGGNGLVVPPKDAEAFFKALQYYFENEIERNRDAVAFQKRVFQNYSEEQVVEQLLDFLKELYVHQEK
ncbi:glycosyltransferase [Salinimicrobium tongyeongense]|uniref:Glycosyltransferase n=1 Tax=Salinimicrobium tongyeongense TaxID=2809707 RepID=A0ABY6NRT5_9FLAO|nr:glycosyltransferase [Salinimicrobium tongyeongense]UZH55624.1 glycosyltransferase [Salinimicrobium tongyeongense]